MKTKLTQLLNIKHPIIQAPMFLVSNVAMVTEAMKGGIAGCIPALNYRTLEELRAALKQLKANKVEGGAFGFNLIVNKSNLKYKGQLEVICQEGCDFIITSLGSPEETIKQAHKAGIKVFCDVTDLRFAVISAGGVGCRADIDRMLSYGAEGVSVGSPFIASVEAEVTDEYKQACVDYGADDIVMTQRISGTPCTVINTPYIQKIGTKESWIESVLNKNRKLKKWVKMIRFSIGMKDTENAAKKATYKTVWVAGPSIEHTKAILPVKDIIAKLVS